MATVEQDIMSRYTGWRIFGSGTWSSPTVPSPGIQTRVVFAFLYETAKLFRVPFGELVWATRHECGEKFGREHYHWLIGGRSIQPRLTHCFQLNSLWDSLPKAGYARHFLYDSNQHGVDYICKNLSSPVLSERRAQDSYEFGKFGWLDTEVILSNSLLRIVGGRRIEAERCCRAPKGIHTEVIKRRVWK